MKRFYAIAAVLVTLAVVASAVTQAETKDEAYERWDALGCYTNDTFEEWSNGGRSYPTEGYERPDYGPPIVKSAQKPSVLKAAMADTETKARDIAHYADPPQGDKSRDEEIIRLKEENLELKLKLDKNASLSIDEKRTDLIRSGYATNDLRLVPDEAIPGLHAFAKRFKRQLLTED